MKHHITNHRIVRVARDLWGSSSPNQGRATYSRLHRNVFRWALTLVIPKSIHVALLVKIANSVSTGGIYTSLYLERHIYIYIQTYTHASLRDRCAGLRTHSRSNKGRWGSLNHTLPGCFQAQHSCCQLLQTDPYDAGWSRRCRGKGAQQPREAVEARNSATPDATGAPREPWSWARPTWMCQQDRLHTSGHPMGMRTEEAGGMWAGAISPLAQFSLHQPVLSPLIKPNFW